MARSRSSGSQLARLFDRAAQPVYVVSADRSILFCNAAGGEWIGLPPEEIAGQRVDYAGGDQLDDSPGVVSGLCPPPAAFAGEEISAHVSSLTGERGVVFRAARFLPLLDGDGACLAVIALVDGADRHADELEAAAGADVAAEHLHSILRQFRAQQADRHGFEQLLGNSPAMQKVRAQVALAGECAASVTIVGPRGSGRWHVAQAIHYSAAATRHGPLLPIEGALVEAQQFRAALNDSVKMTGGSVLLVDIDQLSEDAQARLKEWLDEQTSRAAAQPRLLCTAVQAPSELAAARQFRPDLAAALATIEIVLPPLRDRLADLPLLVQAMIEDVNRHEDRQVGGIAPQAIELLAAHQWPENLDELRDTIQAAHRAAAGHRIEAADLPERIHLAVASAEFPTRQDEPIVLDDFLREIEIELIERALDRARDNKSHAARLLGLTRPRLYRRMQQLGLSGEWGVGSGEKTAGEQG